jgi:hypothetical protein
MSGFGCLGYKQKSQPPFNNDRFYTLTGHASPMALAILLPNTHDKFADSYGSAQIWQIHNRPQLITYYYSNIQKSRLIYVSQIFRHTSLGYIYCLSL